MASSCPWILVSSSPGSMPRSSASCSLASWNACSASACLPHRYSAIISRPRARSRSGCAATSAVRSGTASAALPSTSSRSARSSAAPVRSSPSRCRSASANGPGTPANGKPAPQRERLRHGPFRGRGVARGAQVAGLAQPLLENAGIQAAGIEPEHVAAARGDKHPARARGAAGQGRGGDGPVPGPAAGPPRTCRCRPRRWPAAPRPTPRRPARRGIPRDWRASRACREPPAAVAAPLGSLARPAKPSPAPAHPPAATPQPRCPLRARHNRPASLCLLQVLPAAGIACSRCLLHNAIRRLLIRRLPGFRSRL